MKVKILKNVEKCNGQKVVKFSSDIGCAEAHWDGEEPVEGRDYFVEIEIPDIVEWKKDVYRSENEHYCIKNDGNFTILVCKVEILVEHGVCVFRIGSSIVTLEMEGVPYPKGTFVEIRSQNLILYNINL